MSFPFSAIVGQDDLKLALLILAVNPAVGGVLVRGDKGSAKSTTARGLSELLPALETGDAAPFVTLPLGATEDRVIGTLDLEKVLRGEKALQPGLLKEAHGGVLYIDEVNLLPDHLVDVLLDVAAMGVNRVQREGLSVEHASVFALVGTMNPEEGSLRPQFLDRFGLCVDVNAPDNPRERAEIVRRRVRYEGSPADYSQSWRTEQELLRQKLSAARELLPNVQLAEELLEAISALCRDYGVRSLRADLVLHRSARALAALEGRSSATLEDVKRVAALVLAHRKRPNPTPQQPAEKNLNELLEQLQLPRPDDESEPAEPDGVPGAVLPDAEPNQEDGDAMADAIFRAVPAEPVRTMELGGVPGDCSGRRALTEDAPRGREVRVVKTDHPANLAVSATLTHAVERHGGSAEPLVLTRYDLHHRVREGRCGARVLFIVDASGSMGAHARMQAVKGVALSLLSDAHARRDEVGVIVFRGPKAELLLPFTREVDAARDALERQPTGGRTPLAHALRLAAAVVAESEGNVLLVLLTDGKGNVPLPGGGDAWAQGLEAAAHLALTPALVLDTEAGLVRSKRAAQVALAMRAELLAVEDFTAEHIAIMLRSKSS
jgi:magnesium chelatase subunit D